MSHERDVIVNGSRPTYHARGTMLNCACARYVDHNLRIVAFHEPGCSGSSTEEQRLVKPTVEGSTPSPSSTP